ncbi:hypothetical protein HZC00_03100 [Candidatus Kaiserbacteria bacterium]|nr:hypothetical protein [Candidatus Kaiserbacteria bacterium]
MFDLNEKIIDLHASHDTTQAGDGVVTIINLFPLWIATGMLTVAFFVILLLFFWRMWELHKCVFGSGMRMPCEQTKRAAGAAAFRFAERAQFLAEKETDILAAEVMRGLSKSLREFGVRRVVSKFEAPDMLGKIERALRALSRTDRVKMGTGTERLDHVLAEYVGTTKGISEVEGVRQNLDNVMYSCVQAIKKVPDMVYEDAIIRVLQKALPRLQSARQRCLTETPTPKSLSRRSCRKEIGKGNFQIPTTESPLGEMIRVINETREAIYKLRPSVAVNDHELQKELFVRELREWIEVTRWLAYASSWRIEVFMWFLPIFRGS